MSYSPSKRPIEAHLSEANINGRIIATATSSMTITTGPGPKCSSSGFHTAALAKVWLPFWWCKIDIPDGHSVGTGVRFL